jgi:ubiquinone/menaquinone biosynthesis C-methylase UbiE
LLIAVKPYDLLHRMLVLITLQESSFQPLSCSLSSSQLPPSCVDYILSPPTITDILILVVKMASVSSSQAQPQAQHPHLPLPHYFDKFASFYARQTGHSTLTILADVIVNHVQTSAHPIGPDSVVHDTAAGPGIGAAALVARLSKDQLPKKMLVSDNAAPMVNAALASLTASPLPDVDCKVLDSQDLASVPNNYFTHSIDNFSIFTFVNPTDAIRETYRTLSPGGLAVITCWRRFAPMFIVHAAQKKIRPDLPLMPTPSPEFYE